MSSFISKPEYLYMIRTYRLDQILEAEDEDEDAILNSAEEEALAIMTKYLGTRYNMAVELAKSGSERSKVLLRWAKVLVLYYIYERVPDEMVPERVVKNYDGVMKMLEKVEDGEASVPGLTPETVTDSDGNSVPATRRRWGSLDKRTHDAGSPRDLCR